MKRTTTGRGGGEGELQKGIHETGINYSAEWHSGGVRDLFSRPFLSARDAGSRGMAANGGGGRDGGYRRRERERGRKKTGISPDGAAHIRTAGARLSVNKSFPFA